MAWAITNRETRGVDGDVPQVTIVMDSTSDASDLPTGYAPGSIAVVADSGMATYMLNASGTWSSVD